MMMSKLDDRQVPSSRVDELYILEVDLCGGEDPTSKDGKLSCGMRSLQYSTTHLTRRTSTCPRQNK